MDNVCQTQPAQQFGGNDANRHVASFVVGTNFVTTCRTDLI